VDSQQEEPEAATKTSEKRGFAHTPPGTSTTPHLRTHRGGRIRTFLRPASTYGCKVTKRRYGSFVHSSTRVTVKKPLFLSSESENVSVRTIYTGKLRQLLFVWHAPACLFLLRAPNGVLAISRHRQSSHTYVHVLYFIIRA
jgi:hypothetical protein